MRLAVVGVALLAIVAFLGIVGYDLARRSGMANGGSGVGGPGKVFGSGALIDSPPHPAPTLSVRLLSGDTWQASAQARPVVVNFWASWCPPCREEMPVLQRTWRRQNDRVAFLGIDVWDTDGAARDFLRSYGVEYPNSADPGGRLAIDFGLTGVPETFFLDRGGRIVHHYIGPLDQASLDSLLASLGP